MEFVSSDLHLGWGVCLGNSSTKQLPPPDSDRVVFPLPGGPRTTIAHLVSSTDCSQSTPEPPVRICRCQTTVRLSFTFYGGLNHPVQVSRRIFNISMLILSRPAFSRQQTAAMDILEIPVREFVMPLGVLGFLVIDAQMPFGILREPVPADKLVFLLR